MLIRSSDIFRSGPWRGQFKLTWLGFCLMGEKTWDREWYLVSFAPYPERIFIKVRRFSFHHFYCHDPKWPDVHFGAVCFSRHHFWCHPIRSPDHCAPFTLLRGDLSTEAEISWGEKRVLLKPAWIMKASKRNPHCMPENALLDVSGKAAVLFTQCCNQGNTDLAA